jgi:hypothetical protein
MNRIVMNVEFDASRMDFYADTPVILSVVRDHRGDAWLETPEVVVGVSYVRAQLGDTQVGHKDDDSVLGTGSGPKKQPSRPKLRAVDDGYGQIPRVVMTIDPQGCWQFFADTNIEVYGVADYLPDDRVYQEVVEIGAERVRLLLREGEMA